MWHVRPVLFRHRRSPALSFGYGPERGGATFQSGSPRRGPGAEKSPASLAEPFTATYFISRGTGRLRSGNCFSQT